MHSLTPPPLLPPWCVSLVVIMFNVLRLIFSHTYTVSYEDLRIIILIKKWITLFLYTEDMSVELYQAYIHILEAELAECHTLLHPKGYKYDYEYQTQVRHPCAVCETSKHLYVIICAECEDKYLICRGCNDVSLRVCERCYKEIWRCRAHSAQNRDHCQRPIIHQLQNDSNRPVWHA